MSTRDKVYQFICKYAIDHGGCPPTYSEVGEALGLYRSTVHHHVHMLLRSGALRKVDGKLFVTVIREMLLIVGEDDGFEFDCEIIA